MTEKKRENYSRFKDTAAAYANWAAGMLQFLFSRLLMFDKKNMNYANLL